MGLPLITKAEYKSHVGINTPNQDSEIDSIIPKVSQLVKSYCKRSFIDYVNDPKSERFNGGIDVYYLKEYPILEVSSVEMSMDRGKSYITLTEDDYVLDYQNEALVPLFSDEFPHYINGYVVTYTAGYETLPEDLKLALFDLVTYYRKNDSAVHSPKAPGTNSVQIEYITTTSLPAHIRRVLDMYVADYT